MGAPSDEKDDSAPRDRSTDGDGAGLIGTHRGDDPGPLLVCVGGVHGNEPAGVRALEGVLEELRGDDAPRVRGRLVALAGNLGALQASVRYRDRDLNRQWTMSRTDELQADAEVRPELGPEGVEQKRLLRMLEATLEEDRRGPAYLVDLHTTSSESPPFGIVGRREACRRFSSAFPFPHVRGLERHLPGMLADWACRRGFASLTAEAGQHDASDSVRRLRAVVWTALASAGLVEKDEPRVRDARALLARASEGVPKYLEVRYRHGITPGNGFRMKPGWKNFDRVLEGDILAEDRTGEIPSPQSGLLFLPLYQKLGSDGFFLVRATESEHRDDEE